jgi:hypothetical protein
MDTLAKYWPHITIGVAATALGIYLIKRSQHESSLSKSTNPFKDIIDQKATQDQKELQGREWMINYVREHLTGENQLKTDSGLLRREDFNHV